MTILGNLRFVRSLRRGAALGQRELVGRRRCRSCVFYFGLHLARRLAIGDADRCLGRSTGKAPTEIVEIAALGGDGLASFPGTDSARLLGGGQVDHGARLDAVDVAADECVGARPKHGHQHLVQRHIGRAVGFGDAARRVAGLNPNLTATGSAGRRRRSRAFGWSRCWRCRTAGQWGWCRGSLDHRWQGRGGQHWLSAGGRRRCSHTGCHGGWSGG